MRMRYFRIGLVLLTVGMGLWAAGCGGDEGQFETISCQDDTDCPSGEICGISGTCVPL